VPSRLLAFSPSRLLAFYFGPQCLQVRLGNPPGSQLWINLRSDLFVGPFERGHGTLDDGGAIRHRKPKLDLGSATKPFLSGPAPPLEGDPPAMQASVHCFMEDRSGDLGVAEAGIHGEGEFDEAGVLVGKIGASARVTLNQDAGEIAPEATEVVGYMAFDQSQRLVQPAEHVVGCYVGPGVPDDDRNAPEGRRGHANLRLIVGNGTAAPRRVKVP